MFRFESKQIQKHMPKVYFVYCFDFVLYIKFGVHAVLQQTWFITWDLCSHRSPKGTVRFASANWGTVWYALANISGFFVLFVDSNHRFSEVDVGVAKVAFPCTCRWICFGYKTMMTLTFQNQFKYTMMVRTRFPL